MIRRSLILLAVVLVQLALVGVAGAGQLSARLTGDDYVFRVEPLDPFEPFRGAYVVLGYPDLPLSDGGENLPDGKVFLPLAQQGEAWGSDAAVAQRPESGPYLTCENQGFSLSCGIRDWFASQAEATRLEDALRQGDVLARVRIDGRGHAALMEVTVTSSGAG